RRFGAARAGLRRSRSTCARGRRRLRASVRYPRRDRVRRGSLVGRLRHLFVTNDFPPKLGGIESYLTNLCKGFDPDDIAVVAPTREGHGAVDADLEYRVVRLPGSYLRAKQSVYR